MYILPRWLAGLALVLAPAVLAAPGGAPGDIRITTFREIQRDTSPPLREILANLPVGEDQGDVQKPIPNVILKLEDLYPGIVPGTTTPRAQITPLGIPAPEPIVAFNGLRIGLGGGGVPPDTTGDVSPTHYFQWVNTSWALFNKATGAIVSGPNSGNSFFAGFGGLCQSTNRGDPLVLWDDAAQRWVVSQFAFNSGGPAGFSPPFLQCLAVSASSDPLGSYHRYAFQFPNDRFNDYGKIGIWRTADGSQNAYLLTMHEFVPAAGTPYAGESFNLVERDRILNGQSAQFIRIEGIPTFGALPFHLEGTTALPTGACPMFVHFTFDGEGYRLWDVCINWGNGTVNFDPRGSTLASGPFALNVQSVPQRDSTILLDAFQGNTMYLAALRAFDGTGPSEAHGAIFHIVGLAGGRAGARWVRFGFRQASIEPPPPPEGLIFRDGFDPPGPTTPTGPNTLVKRIVDDGVYAPGTQYRWMGSINIDRNLNLGMGYTASSTAQNPDIRITGRRRNDPAGEMRDEQICTPPNPGAQLGGGNRWGDYSTTSIDPADDCTFWHTNEYFSTTSNSSWNTRICSFRFPECGQGEFLLELPPERVPVCSTASSDPSVPVRVAALGNLTTDTSLSASGFPGGVTPAFAPASVAPGATSQMALTGARMLAAGLYQGNVQGVNGSQNESEVLRFGVSTSLAGAPTPTSPGNGGGTSIRPTLTWTAVPGALRYKVELSRNAGFTQIVETREVAGTSFVPTDLLLTNTQYFWRVSSVNFCGTGSASTVFSFSTGEPGVCAPGTTPVIAFQDDVSGDAIAWTTANVQGNVATNWNKEVPPAGTGLTTRAWYARNSSVTADQRLISPSITLPNTGQLTLAFDAYHQYETDGTTDCWDGGFVEISTDGGTTFSAPGNSRTLTDPYPGILSSGNPGSPNFAWCRQPQAGQSVRSVFTLDGLGGQNIRLRFRSTADSNTVGPTPNGWAIDNIVVQGCQ